MTKLFFDVFPTLNIDNDSHMLFEKVEVTKITSTSARNHIKVYIYSTHLIPKKTVCYVENQIEEQLFSQGNIPVTIIEEYSPCRHASGSPAYTARKAGIPR